MKIERLIAILTALLQKDVIPASWFADKFGVSVRTIYRDIQVLESAGIPIVTYTGVNGGISILDTYKIDKKLFTHQDISTMLTSLQSLSQSLNPSKINQTLEKIKGLIPEEHIRNIELTSRQLYIDMTPWAGNPIVGENLSLLQQSLTDNRLVHFLYSTRNLVDSERTVEPHQLILKEGNWYLRAFCQSKQAFRTFKLSRMSQLQLQSHTFVPREFDSVIEDYKNWSREHLTEIKLAVTPALRERVLDFCRPEEIFTAKDGMMHITTFFPENDIGYGVLLSFGTQCEVLSPVSVRDELKKRISQLAKIYD